MDYYLGLLLVCALILIASLHLYFLAIAHRYDQHGVPRAPYHWGRRGWIGPPELYTEKGKRYRRQFLAMQWVVGGLWVVGVLVGVMAGF